MTLEFQSAFKKKIKENKNGKAPLNEYSYNLRVHSPMWCLTLILILANQNTYLVLMAILNFQSDLNL